LPHRAHAPTKLDAPTPSDAAESLRDDADPDELAGAPIRYVDGRNDHFDQSPADIRLL